MHNNQWKTLSRKRQPDDMEECRDEQPSTDGQKREISQSRVNHLVFDFIIEDVQPFCLVKVSSIRKLVEGISCGRKVMMRKTLMQRIERDERNSMTLSTKLQIVKSVCTTADIWSAHNISFFGMTCHWIREDTLERKSAALVCVWLRRRHPYVVICCHVKWNTWRLSNSAQSEGHSDRQ